MTRTASAANRSLKALAMAFVALATVVALPALVPGASAAPADARLRLGHFASGTGPIDEYVDGAIEAKALSYTQVTAYAQVAPGPHTVALRAAGAPAGGPPVATLPVTLDPGTSSTVAAFAGSTGVNAQVYRDDLSSPRTGTAKVRIIHALSAIRAVDVFVTPAPKTVTTSGSAVASQAAVALPSSTPAFSGLAFATASPYADLPVGNYEVELRVAGTDQTVVTARDWPVAPNTVASVVVLLGDQGPTFVVLRDAVGAAATPVGAMATGAGGMAHRSGSGLPTGMVWAIGLALAAALVAMVRLVAMANRRTPVVG